VASIVECDVFGLVKYQLFKIYWPEVTSIRESQEVTECGFDVIILVHYVNVGVRGGAFG
jgi:hypothetical protein